MTRQARGAVVAALFVVLTVVHTWPLAGRLSTHQQSGADPRAMLWSLFDQTRNLVERPLEFTDASVFYPYADTLVVLDHQISNAVIAVPAYLAGAGGVTIFNLVLLATFAISGFTTYLLVRRLTGSTAAAVMAGCAFAFGTARVYNLEHIHLLSTQWIPLALLAIHRYLERPTPARWLGLTVSALAVAASSWQIGIIGAFALGIVALWLLVGDGGSILRRGAGLVAAAMVCALILAPLAMTYARVAGYWSQGATVEEWQQEGGIVAQNSASVVDVVALPIESRSPYAGWMARRGTTLFVGFVTLALGMLAGLQLRRRPPPETAPARWPGRAAAIAGLVALLAIAAAIVGGPLVGLAGLLGRFSPVLVFGALFAVASLLAARRVGRSRPELLPPLIYATLAVAGLLLALGPRVTVAGVDLGSGLWRFDLLPIDLSLRAPVRLSLLTGLGFAVLVGYGSRALLERFPQKRHALVLILLLAAINVDLAFGFEGWSEVPRPSGVDRWLAESEEEGAVLEFPLLGHYWGLYASQNFYDRRNVDGMGFIRPPEIRRLRLLEDFSPLQVEMLWEHFHPRFVVVRGGAYSAPERRRVEAAIESLGRALELRARDGDDAVYELGDRGRGARLFRRWPGSFLRDSGGRLVLSGSLTEGHERTIGTLTVLLNDRPMLTVEGAEIAGRPQHVVAFEPGDLDPGINTFELRAGYRYRDGATPNAVGSTGVSLPADLEATVGPEGLFVALNGERYELTPDAQVVAIAVDPFRGGVVEDGVLAGEAGSGGIEAFLGSLAEGTLVALVSRDTLPSGSVLERLGLPENAGGLGALAAIGVVGADAGTGLLARGAEAAVAVGQPERRRVQLRRLEIR